MSTTTDPSRRLRPRYDDLPRLLALVTGDEKHAPSSFSTLDVLWVLYDRVLRVDPAEPTDPERDRFLLSKGHGPAAYYAVLAAFGFLPVGALSTLASFDSPLGHHPDRMLVPGAEISLLQHHSCPVVQVGQTVLALEADIARDVIVTTASDGSHDSASGGMRR